MQVEVEERLNGAVAVTRGPLNYALELTYNVTTTEGLRCVRSEPSFRIYDAHRLKGATKLWRT